MINVFQVNSSADIGSIGMSRFYCQNGTDPTMAVGSGQANAYAAAIAALYSAVKALFPTAMGYQVQSTYSIYDVVSGLVAGSAGYSTVPAQVVGTGSGAAAGGTGARLYWHTITVHNRRLIRGATFLTPFVAAAYSTTDGLSGTTITTIQTAAATFLTSCGTANVIPVVYHRPLKGEVTGGVAAQITGASCTAQPGSLRSRRS
jgi:hypothetical protein